MTCTISWTHTTLRHFVLLQAPLYHELIAMEGHCLILLFAVLLHHCESVNHGKYEQIFFMVYRYIVYV